MDLKFEKGKVTSDFKEAEELQNIESGESISTIFGKIQRWLNNLKDLPKRYYNERGVLCGVILTPENEENTASGANSVASGKRSTSSGLCSTAIGYRARASSAYSNAIGYQVVASGLMSIAMGCDSMASKQSSFAVGCGAQATAEYAMALGTTVTAASESSIVLGRSNIPDENNKYVMIVGNGASMGDHSNGLTLDWDGNLWTAGDVTATDADGNNVSLCETAKVIYNSLGMIKSKNLLKNTAGTTTQNGITFTYNDDGSVTCNGTATANADYIYTITLPQNASFVLSGCPAGGSKSTYSLFARDTATWSIVYFDTGSSRTVKTGVYTTWQVVIRISNGQTVNDLTFYPMLRNADIYADDAEYEPYSDDLQTQINELNAMMEDSGWKNLTGSVYYRKCGKCVEIKGEYTPSSASGGFTLGTLPSGFRPSKFKAVGAFTNDTASKVYRIVAGTDGQVVISGENQNAFTANAAYNLHLSFLVD